MTKEALKLARTALGVQLDAMLGKAGHLRNDDRRRYAENGIKAIDEALAQPEQEPVAWVIESEEYNAEGERPILREIDYYNQVIDQFPAGTKLYTTTPQRKPLTDEEIYKASTEAGMQEHYMGFHSGFIRFARAIEAAHGIKD